MPLSYSMLTGTKATTGSIKSYLNYALVDSVGVLEDAQTYIYQQMRTREMRAAATISLVAGDSTAPLPTGFLDPRGPIRDITNGTRIHLKDEDEIEEARYWTSGVLATGDPTIYGIYSDLIQFEVRARANLTARMLYWKSLTLLSGANETNFLTTRYPHILRATCLAFAAAFFHDNETYAREIQRATAMIEQANEMDELSRRGQDGSPDDYEGRY